MAHGVAAPGLAARPNFHRYTERCSRFMRRAIVVQFTSQGATARAMSRDGIEGTRT
jgi:hypothetical protein